MMGASLALDNTYQSYVVVVRIQLVTVIVRRQEENSLAESWPIDRLNQG